MKDYIQMEKNMENFIFEYDFTKYYLQDEHHGVNSDYILLLKHNNNKTFIHKQNIQQYFQKEYDLIFNYLNNEILEYINISDFYNFISNSNLLSTANILVDKNNKNSLFDYCIQLDGKYLPRISVDIQTVLSKFLENININEFLFKEKYYYFKNKTKLVEKYYILNKKSNYIFLKPHSKSKDKKAYSLHLDLTGNVAFNEYFINKYSLIDSFCSYLLYWIKSYNITMQIRESTKNKSVISFSHRYIGWSQPIFDFKDLKIHFKTNFGYGNSSYFFLMLEYKEIQIVPFMDWINYPYFEASQVLQYTKKIHISQNRKIFINNELWHIAMNFICEASSLYLKNEKLFVEKYIVNDLGSMINELELILKMSNQELDKKYGHLKNHIKINQEKLFNFIGDAENLCIKSTKICGALGFIGKITELSHLINLSSCIKKLEQYNLTLLPLLEKNVEETNINLYNLESELSIIKEHIDYIYSNQNNPMNLKYLNEQQKELTHQEFLNKYPNFHELKQKYKELLSSQFALIQDTKKLKTLLQNIQKYIQNIKIYFANKSNID